MPGPNSSDDRNPVERLAEEFLERRRRGEHPPLSEFVQRFPELEGEIRDLFPALALMERLKPDDDDVTGDFVSAKAPRPGEVPAQLGDFRILREVGRGGMGIVFEAEQESLGRHVALKVLPSHALLNPSHLLRFRREAKAAAKLHHTNIVPVFGVGETDGLHYYVMQFITGSGLNDVVEELKRIRAAAKAPAHASPDTKPKSAPTDRARGLAQGMLTGRFAETETDPAEATADAPRRDGPPAAPSAEVFGHSAILSSGPGRDFAKEVARLGLQVAGALAHAHNQGVLHRDIKPSNLLLDVEGTLWVADFGLAKALADRDDLTHEGDIVGTLRYMAPERFRGEADERSDLYALGLTLYELLTLRPAFNETERDRLIHQVTTEVPPRPRALDPEVPRDLETIILKAIEREPEHRYATAERLAEDLELFLADRPIKAREVGPIERLFKWARRKPAIAALVASLAAAIVVGFAGVTWQWRVALVARDQSRTNEARALSSLHDGLETVNRFCTLVSEEELLEQPRMLPLRQGLLTLARETYQSFQRQHADDKTLRLELALSYQRSARLSSELGEEAVAHSQYIRARNLLEELRREAPGGPEAALRVVRCYLEMEDDLRLSDYLYQWHTMNANLILKEDHPALDLMRPLIAEAPADPEYLLLLGRCYDVVAMRAENAGVFAGARKSAAKGVETLRRARELAPDDPSPARWLAASLANLAEQCDHRGERLARIQALEESLGILIEVQGRSTPSRRDRLERGQALTRLGVALEDTGRYTEARERLEVARDLLDEIVTEVPESFEPRYWLVIAKQGLAREAEARGSSAAISLFTDSIELIEEVPEARRTRRGRLALLRGIVDRFQAKLARGPVGAEEREELASQLDQALRDHDRSNVLRDGPRTILEVRGKRLFALAAATDAGEVLAIRREEAREARLDAERRPDNLSARMDAARAMVELASLSPDRDEARSTLEGAFDLLKGPSTEEDGDPRLRATRAFAWETRARLEGDRDAAGQAVALCADLARIEPTFMYELACASAVQGELTDERANEERAFQALQEAIAGGLDNVHQLRADPRLRALRASPAFAERVRVAPQRQ